MRERLADKQADRNSYADLVNRSKEIKSAYKAWQKSRKELEEWDGIASQFREYEKDRAPLLEQIAVEKAKLEEEQRSLLVEEELIGDQRSVIGDLQNDIEKSENSLKSGKKKLPGDLIWKMKETQPVSVRQN